MPQNNLIPHLFRTEYTKIVSVLCKTYGLSQIELAEDFVSESFLKAAETWGMKGVPENPAAWLYQVAKNKAKDYFKRKAVFAQKVEPELSRGEAVTEMEIDLSEGNIKDSQLRMIFAVCDPINANESQVALALQILCGFGVEEIATALLSNKSTINKRLQRARKRLRENATTLTFPPENHLHDRLSNVLTVLYLLFNEGYYSISSQVAIRKDLCYEAMRLLLLLTSNPPTSLPQVNALMALFCFHASRFEARLGESGEAILFDDQDREKWDRQLIQRGEYFLSRSAQGAIVSKYHCEALIAYWHTRLDCSEEKKWEQILQLYNRLLQVEYSPIAALNRTYALARTAGKPAALKEALKIDLATNHLYHALLAELYEGTDVSLQKKHLQMAIELAKHQRDKDFMAAKLAKLS